MSPTVLMNHIDVYAKRNCLLHIGHKHFIERMYNDINGMKHYALIDKGLFPEEYDAALQNHGANYVAIFLTAAIDRRKALAPRNMSGCYESSVQKMPSYKRWFFVIESKDAVLDQSKHEVDVLKDCSDCKKANFNLSEDHLCKGSKKVGEVNIGTRESQSVISSKKYFESLQQESKQNTEILTSKSVDENINRIVTKRKLFIDVFQVLDNTKQRTHQDLDDTDHRTKRKDLFHRNHCMVYHTIE
eukprot:11826733-Ditylum_brightwellii.AAC.1